jgi:hypothetical protein
MTTKKKPSPVKFGEGSKKNTKNRSQKMNSEVIVKEILLSKSNLDNSVAAFLYAVGSLNDDEDVATIRYGSVNEVGQIPLTVFLKQKEVN